MKNRIIALVVGMILLLFSSITAQAPDTLWTKTYGGVGGDLGYCIQITDDDGFIIAGITTSYGAGDIDVWLIKTDQIGDTLWTQTFGDTYPNWAYSVQQTSDKGYITSGETWAPGPDSWSLYIIKSDSIGNETWTKKIGGSLDECGYDVQETSDTSYIVVGYTTSFGSGWDDVYLVKVDNDGDTLWTRTHGGSDLDIGRSIRKTADSGYIVAGETVSFSSDMDIYLIKTDDNGDTVWTRRYGRSDDDYGNSVQQTTDGGYIIAGHTVTPPGDVDAYIIKTDSIGDTIWTTVVGGDSVDIANSIIQTPDTGYVVTGSTTSFGSGERDLLLFRLDKDGSVLWEKYIGGTERDVGCSVRQTSNGGYIILGYTNSYAAINNDVWLIKTEPDPVNVNEKPVQIPASAELKSTISPNPFTSVATIKLIGSNKNQKSTLTIYDVLGRRVRGISLLPFSFYLGATWDGRDEAGKVLPPGIYFLKLNGKPAGKVVKVR